MKATTEQKQISFILDASGSMQSVRQQVSDGYKKFIDDIKMEENEETEVTFSLTSFNTQTKLIHDCVPISTVMPFKYTDYFPDGYTALNDAVGKTIYAIDQKLSPFKKNHRKRPTVLVVIFTDGMENASKEYTTEQIRELITGHEKQGNWSFIFLGSNQDAWLTGQKYGIAQGNTQTYQTSETNSVLCSTSAQTRNYIQSGQSQTKNFFGQIDTPDLAQPPVKKTRNLRLKVTK